MHDVVFYCGMLCSMLWYVVVWNSMVFCIVKNRSENSDSQFSLPVPKINNPETSKAVIRPSRQTINYDLRVNHYNTSHI